jgi:lipid A 3-O-deacylase
MRPAVLLLCAFLAAAPFWASAEERLWPRGTFTAQIENDRIANTDRHYTNGICLAWVSDKAEDGPQWVNELLEMLYPIADLRAGRAGLSLGQSMFTPEDTDAVDLVRADRPYAGWLYAGVSVHAETKRTRFGIAFDTLDSVELNLGVVGPYALGEETQNTYHDLIGVARSNGWDNQLKNEPGIMLIFERKWRPSPWRLGALELDAVPHLGGALGNVMTLFHAGGTFRIGQSLAVDYGPPLIQPALSGLAAVDRNGDFGWYLFAGADLRGVARNIFLDGNTFADSHSVDRKFFVGNFQLGAALYYKDVRLAFTHVFRTREFEGQRRADRYGALALSVRY